MIMMFAYIFIAIVAQLWNEREVIDEVSKLSNTTFVSREDVDDRSESRLMDDFIVLRLTATDTDNTMCHRFKGIHRGRIAVELVHDSIRTEHRSHVFVKG